MSDMFALFALQRLYQRWIADLEREQGWHRGDRERPTARRREGAGAAETRGRAPVPGPARLRPSRPVRAWVAAWLIALARRLAPALREQWPRSMR